MNENEFVLTDLENVDPSPIAPRMCTCGCGHTFQPNSDSHINVNKKHTDRAYYLQVTKPKQKIRNEIEKAHRRNDTICAKYVNANFGEPTICHWESIIADGYDEQYNQGISEENGIIYIFTYNYYFHLFDDNGLKKIKIARR